MYLKASKVKSERKVKPSNKKKAKSDIEKRGIKELLDELYSLISIILKRFAYRVKVRIKSLDIIVATEDPCRTALVYSAVCNSLNLLTELFTGYDKLEYKVDSMTCKCDFLTEKFSFDMNVEIKIRVKSVISSVIGVLFDLINKR